MARVFYAEVTDELCLLVMDLVRLESAGIPVRFDDIGDGQLFPHIYAPLPCELVDEVRAVTIVDGQVTPV